MYRNLIPTGLVIAAMFAVALGVAQAGKLAGDGLIRVKSSHSVDDTIARAKAKIADLKIKMFDDIDQGALAAGAGLKLAPSHLLIFGNPPLGIQFLTAQPFSGIDWPVRMQVLEDSSGEVWVSYTDFAWIGARHGIKDRDAALAMATQVSGMIASAATGK